MSIWNVGPARELARELTTRVRSRPALGARMARVEGDVDRCCRQFVAVLRRYEFPSAAEESAAAAPESPSSLSIRELSARLLGRVVEIRQAVRSLARFRDDIAQTARQRLLRDLLELIEDLQSLRDDFDAGRGHEAEKN